MAWKEFALHADICNLGRVFLGTVYMSFLQSPDIQDQNMRPNKVDHI